MMQKRTLTFTISDTGAIVAVAHGPGPSCTDELETIRAFLPEATITGSRLTTAYYTQTTLNQILQYENEAEKR